MKTRIWPITYFFLILGIAAVWFQTLRWASSPPSRDPVVIRYKVTYCAPTGEVKTLYTTRYRSNRALWVLDSTGTDYIVINGRYIIEPIVK